MCFKKILSQGLIGKMGGPQAALSPASLLLSKKRKGKAAVAPANQGIQLGGMGRIDEIGAGRTLFY